MTDVDSSLPSANRAKVLLLIVVGSSGSENVNVTMVCGPTPVEPSAGVTISTAGDAVSAVAAVVKLLVVFCSALSVLLTTRIGPLG